MYVFDMDGTLSIVGDRLKHLKSDPPDWDMFYERCAEDEVNKGMRDIFTDLLYTRSDILGEKFVILTGRRESCRKKTMMWLKENDFFGFSDEIELLMRPDGDVTHDTELKPKMLNEFLEEHEKEKVIAIFEDRNSMVKKWRELGYLCLHVAEGDF